MPNEPQTTNPKSRQYALNKEELLHVFELTSLVALYQYLIQNYLLTVVATRLGVDTEKHSFTLSDDYRSVVVKDLVKQTLGTTK